MTHAHTCVQSRQRSKWWPGVSAAAVVMTVGLTSSTVGAEPDDAGVATQIEAIEARLSELENRTGAQDTQIEDLRADIAALRVDNAAQDTTIGGLQAAIDALRAEVADQDTEIAGLQAENADQVEQIAALRAENADQDAKLAAQSAAIGSNAEETDELVDALMKLSLGIKQFNRDVGGRLDALEAEVAGLREFRLFMEEFVEFFTGVG